jgi:hypothetical protein
MPALNFPDSPTNGQTFSGYVYSTTEGVWNRLPDAPGINLSNLGDVSVSSLSSGQSLVYNGAEWSNTPLSNNVIINGNFDIWQRGTSFSPAASIESYTADRFSVAVGGSGSMTVSRQSFAIGELSVHGYGQPTFYLRTTGNSSDGILQQRIEDVRVLAGQKATFSFWARSSTLSKLETIYVIQVNANGIDEWVVLAQDGPTLTSSWQRYKYTFDVPASSGNTPGSNSFLTVRIDFPMNVGYTVDTWGWQLEAGSVATPFKLAGGGNPGAELALCQRYYYRTQTGGDNRIGSGYARTTTLANIFVPFPVQLRFNNAPLEQSGTAAHYGLVYLNTGVVCSAVPTLVNSNANGATVAFTVAAGLTAGQGLMGYTVVNTNGYLAWNAEL